MHPQQYERNQPFLATLKDIYRLNREGSMKETYHLALDISGSGICFSAGDSVGILPEHDPILVQRTLDALHATGSEMIKDKRTLEERTLYGHLKTCANITRLHKSFLEELLIREKDVAKQNRLQEILDPSNHDKFLTYAGSYEVWDVLLEYPEVRFTPQEIADLLPPLLPRFYSIASSLYVHPDEVHLTVAMSDFEAGGKKRFGVGTHFLCRLVKEHNLKVPIYVQPSHGFSLPEDKTAPIIMVGPGTGVAPFRAFLQERLKDQHVCGKNWLFFGECTRKHDFFYEDFLQELVDKNFLRLDLAFSREMEHKIYVQHKMLEKKQELWLWLEAGAYFYVCGDLQYMAKDVDAALHTIVQDCAGFNETETKAYVKKLRKEKRYLRDVY